MINIRLRVNEEIRILKDNCYYGRIYRKTDDVFLFVDFPLYSKVKERIYDDWICQCFFENTANKVLVVQNERVLFDSNNNQIFKFTRVSNNKLLFKEFASGYQLDIGGLKQNRCRTS